MSMQQHVQGIDVAGAIEMRKRQEAELKLVQEMNPSKEQQFRMFSMQVAAGLVKDMAADREVIRLAYDIYQFIDTGGLPLVS